MDVMGFAGSASRRLGEAIAGRLGAGLGASEVIRFSGGNLFVRVLENVRGRDVFIVQGTAFPANDTDSVETQPAGLSGKVEVVSVAALFAQAIRRIAARESVSVLFR